MIPLTYWYVLCLASVSCCAVARLSNATKPDYAKPRISNGRIVLLSFLYAACSPLLKRSLKQTTGCDKIASTGLASTGCRRYPPPHSFRIHTGMPNALPRRSAVRLCGRGTLRSSTTRHQEEGTIIPSSYPFCMAHVQCFNKSRQA